MGGNIPTATKAAHNRFVWGILALLLYLGWTGHNYLKQRKRAFEKALQLAKDKGIINLGSGTVKRFNPLYPWDYKLMNKIASHPKMRVNLDFEKNGVPNFMRWDLAKNLPFGDKEFDVAFMSHILEHLTDWNETLREARRIADYVVIVLPNPFSPGHHCCVEHKQFFDFDDIKELRKLPNVHVYV